ncbi:hypothetical protein OEA41_001274 [Lepraria neglecta]|uniref:Protein kinase domain-containing protein n=1 Tax=Lepraria neglecta TaxID=209136 RepID=A0AAE0DLR6_9LECA|nr:hypothetical protein OEA41_001274 [Lepraria neglecta]
METHNDDVVSGDTERILPSIRQDLEETETHPPHEASAMDPPSSLDILKIIPSNEKAKLAFDNLVQKKLSNILDNHHSQYIVMTRKGPPERSNTHQPRPGDETTGDEENEGSGAAKDIHYGHFRINFDCRPFLKNFNFVLGRGSERLYGAIRNVDILLAAAKTKYSDGLKAAHALLAIHPESGAWMLSATADPPSAQIPEEGTVIFNDEGISQDQSRCLSRPHSTLAINGMQYDVRFAITEPEQEPLYRTKRDEALEAAGIRIPDTIISGIPFDIDGITKTAVFRYGLGSGSFGRVFEGFDRTTGDLRVVKKIQLNHEPELPLAENEIKANQLFGGFEGIVTLYECSNSEGGQSTKAGRYPFDVFLVQERGVAFNKYLWQAEDPVPWNLRSVLLGQLLKGLIANHQQGCMHRDITPMNVLYFSQEPKHAAFCDFGKICYSKTDTDSGIANWLWLPPEIEEKNNPAERNTYDQKIDVWMLGITILYSWYPQVLRGLRTPVKSRFSDHEMTICSRLKAERLSGLSPLLLKMISWDVKDRPTAEQALNYPCLVNAAPEPAKSSDRKRLQS